jgi:hypothetical protein
MDVSLSRPLQLTNIGWRENHGANGALGDWELSGSDVFDSGFRD